MKRKEAPGPPQLSKKQAKRDSKRAAAVSALTASTSTTASASSRSASTAGAAVSVSTNADAAATAAGSSVYKRVDVLPAPCPFTNPQSRFYTPADKKVYSELIRTSYDGFVVDPPVAYDAPFHDDWAAVFADFDAAGIFQYDYTQVPQSNTVARCRASPILLSFVFQPAGLKTKIAKTFVTRYENLFQIARRRFVDPPSLSTRCLVGEAGITYKYLGLRMFAHPWDATADDTRPSFATVGRLNTTLIKRSVAILRGTARQEVGSCQYNLTLINRCFPSDEIKLKLEPLFEKDKATVSWHADSSLEHYSSIAVYHATQAGDGDDSWRIALRVLPHAEGPSAGKQSSKPPGATDASSDEPTAPPVAVPLPSRHAYFLLDNFNHHHQHSVLAGNSHRYASTHRVSRREGHTFGSIQARCSSALQGHGFGVKQVRAEQLALLEVEFEWVRQFYVQGQRHYDLHGWWQSKVQDLLGLFEQLELRTLLAVKTLGDAAAGLGRPGSSVSVNDTELSRKDRKALSKRRKRASTVEEKSYDELISALTDRHAKRDGWLAREKDPAFKAAPAECRPMRIPFRFPSVASAGGEWIADTSNGLTRQTFLLETIARVKQWREEFINSKLVAA